MKVAEVRVDGCRCETTRLNPIPKGIVGAEVSIKYTDSMWDSLEKTVIFKSTVTRDVLSSGTEVIIPAEVVARAGVNLYMGVYGVDAENHVAVPTIWTELGVIQGAATPSGDASTSPTLPVWAQIQNMIGDLCALDTDAKSSLVVAINEALTKGGGSGGTDISLGLTSAAVGQTVRIKAVDADGKPTAWEAAESGEKWEKIAEIIIPDDAEESNALTIDKDINGQPFALLKARLCSKFPKYTGESTIPGYSFAMLNGKNAGNPSPAAYTAQWPKVSSSIATGSVYEVDVSGVQTVESVLRSPAGGWNMNNDVYGNSVSSYTKYFTDSLWAKPITSIGGTGMLIYPGCKFVLYGVRA